jgi:hypothetical protein
MNNKMQVTQSKRIKFKRKSKVQCKCVKINNQIIKEITIAKAYLKKKV